MVSVKAKNVEVYIGDMDASTVDISARGNNVTIAAYVDGKITATDITDWTKIGDTETELTIDGAEDDPETRNYFGSTTAGAQNSATETTTNNDVDITLTMDSQFIEALVKFGLADSGITNSTYTNYESFNMGSASTITPILFCRIKRQVGSIYYFKNIAIEEPVFKKMPLLSGSADDTVISDEYTVLGNKSRVYIDFYSGTNETLTNM
jgi:hypothetical protein